MSEERREMDNILKEVNDFFQQYGVLEAVEAFLHSEEVTERVKDAASQLVSNMRKMENNAPNDEFKRLANEARTSFESDHACFIEDVLNTFKVNFSSAMHLVVDMTADTEILNLFLDSIRKSISAKGMMDINDICATLVEMYSKEFMKTLYTDYVPDEMSEELADFIHSFLGCIMIPSTAVFPELMENLKTESASDETPGATTDYSE